MKIQSRARMFAARLTARVTAMTGPPLLLPADRQHSPITPAAAAEAAASGGVAEVLALVATAQEAQARPWWSQAQPSVDKLPEGAPRGMSRLWELWRQREAGWDLSPSCKLG